MTARSPHLHPHLPSQAAVLNPGGASPLAQFHAALLLRDASVLCWSSLPAAEAGRLRAGCLAAAASPAYSRPVTGALAVAGAVLWKRGWLDGPGAAAGLLAALQAAAGGSPGERLAGAQLGLAVVQEMDGAGRGKGAARGVSGRAQGRLRVRRRRPRGGQWPAAASVCL